MTNPKMFQQFLDMPVAEAPPEWVKSLAGSFKEIRRIGVLSADVNYLDPVAVAQAREREA